MGFDSFRGNPAAVSLLRAAAGGRRTGHAYLFYGSEGTGKRTLAGIFAQALLCGGGEERPCGRCVACRKFEKGAHPDYTVLRKPADKAFLVVDQIRALREEIYIRPNEADRRVVLIENCETMNAPAANALLKVLEEPPSYAVFLLSAKNERMVPETNPSRCTGIELFAVPAAEAEEWIAAHFPASGPEERRQALLYGNGNLGRSRAFLEDPAVQRGYGQALSLARALTSRREYDILEALAPFDGDRSGFSRLLSDFDGILGRVAVCPFAEREDPEAAELSRRISPLQAAALHDEIDAVRTALFFNGNAALTAALFGARLKTVMETQG